MANPCRNCVYFHTCGETTRTAPCDGRRTKNEQKEEKQKAENLSLMERLMMAGFHLDELDHSGSHLYVPVTPLSGAVIDKWLEDKGLAKHLFVSEFKDQRTGKPMYEVVFQYDPYWANLGKGV